MVGRSATFELRGAPYERGLALGRTRAAAVADCLRDWLRSLTLGGVASPRTYLAEMLERTAFLAAVKDHAPDLLEEVHGLAEGSSCPFGLIFAAQCMDEEWAYRAKTLRTQPKEKCSTVGVKRAEGGVLIGQNMDLGGYTAGHQILYRLSNDDAVPGALIPSVGCMIGLLGVNTSGIAVCVNSIPQLPSQREGLPVAFMIRKLLQTTSLGAALDQIGSVPHATGQHYLIADAAEIVSLEASPDKIVRYMPADRDCILHTNHPLAAELVDLSKQSENSRARLACLTQRLEQDRSLEAIKATLASRDDVVHPISRMLDPARKQEGAAELTSYTTCSLVSVLDAKVSEIESFYSAGPPSVQGYERVTLTPC